MSCNLFIDSEPSGILIYSMVASQLIAVGLMIFSIYHTKNNNRHIFANTVFVYFLLNALISIPTSVIVPYQGSLIFELSGSCGPNGWREVVINIQVAQLLTVILPFVLIVLSHYILSRDEDSLEQYISQVKYTHILIGWVVGISLSWIVLFFVLPKPSDPGLSNITLYPPLFIGLLTPFLPNLSLLDN